MIIGDEHNKYKRIYPGTTNEELQKLIKKDVAKFKLFTPKDGWIRMVDCDNCGVEYHALRYPSVGYDPVNKWYFLRYGIASLFLCESCFSKKLIEESKESKQE